MATSILERAGRRIGPAGTMDAARGRRLLPPLHVAALWTALIVANVWFLSWTVAEMVLTDSAADWHVFERAAGLIGNPALYAPNGAATFQWSPLTPYLLAGIEPLGLLGWRLLHIVAALALPSWKLRLLVLASWPFWADLSLGNVLTFVFVAAVYALRGSRLATFAVLAIALLIPRPLMVPIVLWLLWQRPEWRAPFAAMFGVHALLVLATGLGDEWMQTIIGASSGMQGWIFNLSPSRWLGNAWLLIGVPLAGWLTWRGRVGWAGLAMSPYVWPYYLLFGFLSRDLVEPLQLDVAVSRIRHDA